MASPTPNPTSPEQTKLCGDSYGVSDALLQQLLAMDVHPNLAVRALQGSNNSTVSAAFDWLASFSPEEAEELATRPLGPDDSDEWEDEEEDEPQPKMVLVVNTDLKMKPGKMAAQVGHAVLGLNRVMERRCGSSHAGAVQAWAEGGERMVVVKAGGEEALQRLRKQAQTKNLCTYLVTDAGLTQIPEGSRTVLGIFGLVDKLEEITGGLKLY